MRCPNCGNENPADYVFCDECGARLQPLADTGQGDSASGPMPIGMSDMGGGSGDGMGDMQASGDGDGGWQPPGGVEMAGAASASGASGADWQPQASGDMDAGAAASDDGAAMSEAGAGTMDEMPQDAWNYGDQSGPMSAGGGMAEGGATEEEPVPATEDTMAAGGDAEEGAGMAGGEEGEGMPGVMPMAGSYSDQEGVTQSGGALSEDWMSSAMRYLDEAQRALDNLRRHLGSASAGAGMGGAYAQSDMSSGAGTVMESESGPMSGGASMATDMGSIGTMESGSDWGMGTSGAGDSGAGMGMGGYGSDMGMSGAGAGSAAGMVYGAPDESLMPGMPDLGMGGAGATLEPAAEAGALGADDMSADGGMGAGAAEAQEAPAETAEPVMARLVLIATGNEMPLPDQEEITIGREDPSSGIFPDIDLTPYGGEDGGVSRRHAKLLRIGDDFFVEDLQSTNYTKLDGQRLPAHVRERLEDGARLDFGRVATIFRRS